MATPCWNANSLLPQLRPTIPHPAFGHLLPQAETRGGKGRMKVRGERRPAKRLI